jgi:hypothetical protein
MFAGGIGRLLKRGGCWDVVAVLCVCGGGVLPGGATPTGWPHTAQSGEPDCRGPKAKPHQRVTPNPPIPWWLLDEEAAISGCSCGTYWFVLCCAVPWFEFVSWPGQHACGSTCALMRVVLLCRASCGPTRVACRITTRGLMHRVDLTVLFCL